MDIPVINFEEKFGKIKELYSYKLIAPMNDYDFKLVRAKREFIWHKHPETDEVNGFSPCTGAKEEACRW